MIDSAAVVVDASVVVKWILTDEDYSGQARGLLARALSVDIRLVGPPLVVAEATNATYQRFRRDELGGASIDQLMELLWTQPVEILSAPDLTRRAFQFVRRHRLANVYDSHYVVLAEMLDTTLWTGDRRFFNSVSEIAPRVRWIGDFRPEMFGA